MFGSLGGAEFVLILVLALLLFGPRKLPQIGRSIGRALAEFRGAAQEFKSNLEREVDLDGVKDVKKDLSSLQRELKEAAREVNSLGVARGAKGGPETSGGPSAERETKGGRESGGAGSDPA